MPLWLKVTILAFLSVTFIAAATSAQQLESARKLMSSKAPSYPALARSMRLEGTVKLRVTVSASGTAKSSEVIGGNPLFARVAQEAVANWKWTPAAQETQELVNLDFRP